MLTVTAVYTHVFPISQETYVAGALGVDAVHLMAICELDESCVPASPMTQQASSQRSRAHFGFAFLDAAAGRFFVGTAKDDAARANLGAILTQVMLVSGCHSTDCADQFLELYWSTGCICGVCLCLDLIF